MEQITTPLTAKIKSGHGALMMTFEMSENEDGDTVIHLNDKKTEFEPNDKLLAFLNACIGAYTINSRAWAITFEDSRDFMQYQLAVEDGDIGVK